MAKTAPNAGQLIGLCHAVGSRYVHVLHLRRYVAAKGLYVGIP